MEKRDVAAGSFQAELSLESEERELISTAKGSEIMVMVMKNKLDRSDLEQPLGAISSY